MGVEGDSPDSPVITMTLKHNKHCYSYTRIAQSKCRPKFNAESVAKLKKCSVLQKRIGKSFCGCAKLR